jgi:hypothetical protein
MSGWTESLQAPERPCVTMAVTRTGERNSTKPTELRVAHEEETNRYALTLLSCLPS